MAKKLLVSGSLKGSAGNDGKSAYQYAIEAGYTGTEEEFASKLASKNLDIIFITQAEYDALSEEEKQAGTYFITDKVEETDTSLSKAGMAADAWAVGYRLGKLEASVNTGLTELNDLIGGDG